MSSSISRYEKCIIKADELEQQITKEIDKLSDLKAELISQIMKIGDSDCEKILMLRYIKLCSWKDVADAVGFTERCVYRRHIEALALFEGVMKKVS